jgi:hypothetical protein
VIQHCLSKILLSIKRSIMPTIMHFLEHYVISQFPTTSVPPHMSVHKSLWIIRYILPILLTFVFFT